MTRNIPSLEKQLLIDGYRHLNRMKDDRLDLWDPQELGELKAGELCTLLMKEQGTWLWQLDVEVANPTATIFLGQACRPCWHKPNEHLSYWIIVHTPDGPKGMKFRLNLYRSKPGRRWDEIGLELNIETFDVEDLPDLVLTSRAANRKKR